MKSKRILIIAFIISVFTVSAFSQKTVETCSIKTWIEDPEIPKIDDRLRAQPKYESKSLMEIPFAFESGDETEVEIVGFSNGYVKVRKAFNEKHKINFNGKGWIWANRIAVKLKHENEKAVNLYALPKSTSKKIGKILDENYSDFIIIGFDCFGLKVEYNRKKGWISKKDICGNLTECQ